MQLKHFKFTDSETRPYHITWQTEEGTVLKINTPNVPELVFEAYKEFLTSFSDVLASGSFLKEGEAVQYLEFNIKEDDDGMRMDAKFKHKIGMFYPQVLIKNNQLKFYSDEELKELTEKSYGAFKDAQLMNKMFSALEQLEINIESQWDKLTSTRQLSLNF